MNFGRVAGTCGATNKPVAGCTRLDYSLWFPGTVTTHVITSLWLMAPRVLSTSFCSASGSTNAGVDSDRSSARATIPSSANFCNRGAVRRYIFHWRLHHFLCIVLHRAWQGSAPRCVVIFIDKAARHLRWSSFSFNENIVFTLIECDPRGGSRNSQGLSPLLSFLSFFCGLSDNNVFCRVFVELTADCGGTHNTYSLCIPRGAPRPQGRLLRDTLCSWVGKAPSAFCTTNFFFISVRIGGSFGPLDFSFLVLPSFFDDVLSSFFVTGSPGLSRKTKRSISLNGLLQRMNPTTLTRQHKSSRLCGRGCTPPPPFRKSLLGSMSSIATTVSMLSSIDITLKVLESSSRLSSVCISH